MKELSTTLRRGEKTETRIESFEDGGGVSVNFPNSHRITTIVIPTRDLEETFNKMVKRYSGFFGRMLAEYNIKYV